MPLPHWIARFNKRVTNRFMEPLARRFSNFAVVTHVGRVSGTIYKTPINLFAFDAGFIAALTYGPDADWVRNVQSNGGAIETTGVVWEVSSAEIVGRNVAWIALPGLVRVALRVMRVRHFLRIEVAQ